MKRINVVRLLIVGLIYLFLVFPCYASYSSDLLTMNYSEAGRKAAERTNEELAEEISELLSVNDKLWLKQAQRDLDRLDYMIYLQEEVRRKALLQRRLNNSGYLFGGILKLGIAYWGFKQENAYGNVTGSLFALSGIVQIVTIKW